MNRYCRTVNPNFLQQLNKKKPTTMARSLQTSGTVHRDATTAEPTTTMTAATIC